MKLAHFLFQGNAGVGLVQDRELLDLRDRYKTIRQYFSANSGRAAADTMRQFEGAARIPLDQLQLGPPVAPDTKVFAIAANYRSHAKEIGGEAPPPQQPVIFSKFYETIIGPGEPIQLSPLSQEMDYEGELAVIVGRPARRVAVAEALQYVGGYTLLNDVSARDLQWTELGGRQIVDWFSAKALERSCPIGPWVVTADEIGDPQALQLLVRYNGDVVQDESTAMMIHTVRDIIAYISARIPLAPGDVIATGTPAGVGKFRGLRLQDGDTVEVEIPEIGTLSNPVAGR